MVVSFKFLLGAIVDDAIGPFDLIDQSIAPVVVVHVEGAAIIRRYIFRRFPVYRTFDSFENARFL